MSKPSDYVDIKKISSILSQLEKSKTPNILEHDSDNSDQKEQQNSSSRPDLAIVPENSVVSQDNRRRSTKRKGSALEDMDSSKKKRKRFLWSDELHRKFVAAIFDYGLKEITPKTLGVLLEGTCDELTSDNIKSHLQKYRLNAQKGRSEFLHYYDRSCKIFQEQQSKGLLTDSQMTKFGIYPFSPEPAYMSLNGPSEFQDYSFFDLKQPTQSFSLNPEMNPSLSSFTDSSKLISTQETEGASSMNHPPILPALSYNSNTNNTNGTTHNFDHYSFSSASNPNLSTHNHDYSNSETINTTHILMSNNPEKASQNSNSTSFSSIYPSSTSQIAVKQETNSSNLNQSYIQNNPSLSMENYSNLYSSSSSLHQQFDNASNQSKTSQISLPNSNKSLSSTNYNMNQSLFGTSPGSHMNEIVTSNSSNQPNPQNISLSSVSPYSYSESLPLSNSEPRTNTNEENTEFTTRNHSYPALNNLSTIQSPSLLAQSTSSHPDFHSYDENSSTPLPHTETNTTMNLVPSSIATDNGDMSNLYNDVMFTQMQLHQDISRQHETRQINNGYNTTDLNSSNIDVQDFSTNPFSLFEGLSIPMNDSYFPSQPTVIDDTNPWSFLQDN